MCGKIGKISFQSQMFHQMFPSTHFDTEHEIRMQVGLVASTGHQKSLHDFEIVI